MKNRKILLYTLILVVLLCGVLGVTFGYMYSKISGNESAKKFTAVSQVLKVEFSDGSETITTQSDEYFVPGSYLTKTFTLNNKSTKAVRYSIILDEFSNPFTRDDLTYEVFIGSDDTGELIASGLLPKTSPGQLTNVLELEKDGSVTITLKITYNESDENQIVDTGKIISGVISVQLEENSFKDFIVYGNSVQNGTPSPTTPVEIESVGNKVKNYWPNSYYIITSSKVTEEEDGWLYLEYDNSAGTSVAYVNFWPVINDSLIKGKTYTFVVETQEFDSSVSMFISQYRTSEIPQFNSNLNLTNMQSNSNYYLTTTYNDESGEYLSRSFISIPAGANVQLRFRISLLEGTINNQNYLGYDAYKINEGKYSVPIAVSGKNLFDQDGWYNFYANNSGTMLNLLTNNVVVDGYNTMSWHPANGHNGEYILYPFEGKTNTQYTISFTCKGETVQAGTTSGIGFRYSDGTSTSIYCGNKTEWNTVIGTSTANKTVVGLFMPWNYGVKIYFIKNSIKLYEGSYTLDTIGAYEPYIAPVTYNVILDEPLRKVESSVDYLDFYNKKVYRNVKERIFTGEENWIAYGNGYAYYLDDNFNAPKFNSLIGNYFLTSSEGDDRPAIRFQIATPTNRLYIFDDASNSLFSNLDGLKNWLSLKNTNGNPFKIQYQLSNTSEPENVEGNIGIIPKNAIITVGTNVEPSKIESD